jgi:hypothetical protein
MEDEEWCAMDEKARSQRYFCSSFSQISIPLKMKAVLFIHTLGHVLITA